MSGLRWQAGPDWARAPAEAWCRGDHTTTPLRADVRRQLVPLESPHGPLLLKRFRSGTGRHRLREGFKGWIGRSGAEREWRVLVHLHAAGAPVPEPLALGREASGDRVLVMRFVAGAPLAEALAVPPGQRRRLLAALGAAVAAMHRAGVAHRDLHHGNVLVRDGAVTLLDFQRARRTRASAERVRDLGWLDYSLAPFLSTCDRLRVRGAALGLGAGRWDAEGRRALRAVGRASARRAEAHARSRTRHAARPGRRFARVTVGNARGLRDRELPEDALRRVVADHGDALACGDPRMLKHDGRSRITAHALPGARVVVKEVDPRGIARRLADAVRGSAARRAWRGGHGLRARGVDAAQPLALLERRRWGLPQGSLVVLEDLHPARPADALAATGADAGALLDALVSLLLTLHRRGIEHGDLKASHVWLAANARGPARLLDLEGVRFRGRLSARRRLHALAQLNASLPDALPSDARRRAFERYARRLPFPGGAPAALRALVTASLAREHRWSGSDCALAHPSAPGTRPTSAPG